MHRTSLKSFILIFSALFLFFGCKKSSNSSSASSDNTTTVGTGNPSGTYYGFMMLTSINIIPNAFTSSGTAAFFSLPVPMGGNLSMIGTTTITTGSVCTMPLTYSVSPSYYPLGTPMFPPATWNIIGAGTIPSFTYTNNDAVPIGPSGISLLGISLIHKNQPLSISLIGSSGADQVIVTVKDSANKQISVFISANASSITIPKDSLNKLNSCSVATIMLSLIKYNSQTFVGNSFLFATCRQQINNTISLQ